MSPFYQKNSFASGTQNNFDLSGADQLAQVNEELRKLKENNLPVYDQVARGTPLEADGAVSADTFKPIADRIDEVAKSSESVGKILSTLVSLAQQAKSLF